MDKTSLDRDAKGKQMSELDEEDLFEKLQDWYEADDEHSLKWRGQARKNYDFYAGRQWEQKDIDKLTDEKRPVITFNRCIAILKSICGLEINSRHDTVFLPRESENDEVRANEVLTAGSNWMADGCDAEDEQSEAFQDTLITGMGWTESVVEFEREADGAYVEKKMDPLEMRWDKNARSKNVADAKRLWRVRSIPMMDAQEMFPDEDTDDLDATWANADQASAESNGKTREQKRKRDENAAQYDPKGMVTIVHVQWIEKETYYRVAHPKVQIDQMNGQPRIVGYEELELNAEEFADYKAKAEEAGIPFESTKQRRPVYKQAFLGNKILGEGVMDGPVKDAFSWNCITGERDANEGTWFGLIDIMRDPQMWANKWLAQTLHILNTTAKGGILAEKRAFDDIREAQKTYAKQDAITVVADNAIKEGRIMQKPGTGIAGPYVQLMEFAISAIRDVPGINLELLGMRDANQPGILEHQRKQAGMTILGTLFDSLRRFRKRVGRVRLYYLQEYFADGRMVRVAGPDGQKFMRMVKDQMMGKYDVEVDDAPTSPNQREQNWFVIQQIMPVIKDLLDPTTVVMLLEYSPLPAQVVEALKKLLADPEKDQQAKERHDLAVAGEKTKIDAVAATASKDKTAAQANRAKAILDIASAYQKGAETRKADAQASSIHHDMNMDQIMAEVAKLAQTVIEDATSELPQPPALPVAPRQQMPGMVDVADLPVQVVNEPIQVNGYGQPIE